jgi:hypothetical protein
MITDKGLQTLFGALHVHSEERIEVDVLVVIPLTRRLAKLKSRDC